jgi:branched-chain amino acid aminotransferase
VNTIQWRSGQWVESNSIEISQEVLTGQGVFETILVSEGVPLFFEQHLARLVNSCQIMGFASPDLEVIRSGVNQLLSIGAGVLGRLRVTYFGGALLMSLVGVDPWPASARVILSPWVRNPNSAITGAKSVSYAENAVALNWAKDRKYDEILFFSAAGDLSEASTSNVVVVVGGKALTPALSSGCLPGITRSVLLERGLVVEADIDGKLLAKASSAALLSSTRGVQPIRILGELELDVSCDQLRLLADSYQVHVESCKQNWARLPKESRPV